MVPVIIRKLYEHEGEYSKGSSTSLSVAARKLSSNTDFGNSVMLMVFSIWLCQFALVRIVIIMLYNKYVVTRQ